MFKKIVIFLIAVTLCCFFYDLKSYALQTDWIYYSNENDVGRLYKIRSNGTGITRLSMQTAYEFEVLGDWVYYCNFALTGGAFRTKTDGSVTEKLIDGSKFSCCGLYKDNEHIYIQCTYDTSIYGEVGTVSSELWIFDNNGYVSKVTLNSAKTYSRAAKCIEVVDNCIYYSLKTSDKSTKYFASKLIFSNNSVHIDTKKIKQLPLKVLEKAEKQNLQRSDTSYFRDKYLRWKPVKDAEKYIIYRLNPQNGKYRKIAETNNIEIDLTVTDMEYNGTYKVNAIKTINGIAKKYKVKMIEKAQEDISVNSFAVSCKNVNYVCGNDGIYRITENSTKKIRDGQAEHLCIANKQLYFVSNDHIYRMNLDGSEETLITSVYTALGFAPDINKGSIMLTVNCMAVYGDKILINFDGGSEGYDVHTMIIGADDNSAFEINSIRINDICFAENKIIVLGDDRSIYSMKRDGSDMQCISKNYADSIYAYNDKVYYSNDDGIFEMNSDGTGVSCIYDGDVNDISIYNDRIYFIKATAVRENYVTQYDLEVLSMNLDGTEQIQYMSSRLIQTIDVCGNYVFIKDTLGKYYKYAVTPNADV